MTPKTKEGHYWTNSQAGVECPLPAVTESSTQSAVFVASFLCWQLGYGVKDHGTMSTGPWHDSSIEEKRNMANRITEPIEMSVTDARRQFLSLVDELADEEGVVRVTKHGRPAIAMVPWRAYERAQEILATVEVLSDPHLVEQIRQGEREIEAGEGLTLEELESQIAQDLERGDS